MTFIKIAHTPLKGVPFFVMFVILTTCPTSVRKVETRHTLSGEIKDLLALNLVSLPDYCSFTISRPPTNG